MPIVFRCSQCDTLVRSTESADSKEGTCTQCGAVTEITEPIAEWSDAEDAKTQQEIHREEGTEPEVIGPDHSIGRDLWIPLAMIVAAVAARIAASWMIVSREVDAERFETTAFVLILSFVTGLSIFEAALKMAFTAVLGLVAMVIQSKTIGTPFGTFGSAMLKVIALMMFTPVLVCVGVLALVLWFDEPGAGIGSLILLPVFIGTFFVLTKWFFDMEIFEALVFMTIVLLGPIIMSHAAEWSIENGGPIADAVQAWFGQVEE